ncbi:hypothetical protein V6N11_083229 [Hibiscus sabdariffa]|uniref:Uncharacterized protein n=1 Tax=Hibiscus sabdariffa TaxID=183260 RepID=A0ABR2QLT1_9ROSI
MSMGMGEDDLMNPGVEVFTTIKDIERDIKWEAHSMPFPMGQREQNVRCNILVSHGYLYVECQGSLKFATSSRRMTWL